MGSAFLSLAVLADPALAESTGAQPADSLLPWCRLAGEMESHWL